MTARTAFMMLFFWLMAFMSGGWLGHNAGPAALIAFLALLVVFGWNFGAVLARADRFDRQ